MDIQELANKIDQAAMTHTAIAQLSQQDPFSVADAYAIQAASLEQRYARGEKLIGVKMGFTSEAKMKQMGVNDMIFGRLTNTMLIQEDGELSLGNFIHPRVEPELCFLVEDTIDRELTPIEVRHHIEAVAPALEIIDSRYEQFKFSLEDVIADNCSSSAFFVGKWQSPEIPIHELKMELEIDGEVVEAGFSSAILGNPWKAVQAATRLAAQYGQVIPRGAYIMAGAATPAVYLKSGSEVRLQVARLGSVGFSVVE